MFKTKDKLFICAIILFSLVGTRCVLDETTKLAREKQELNQSGVKTYKAKKCYNGYTLFLRYQIWPAGTINYHLIYLIDMRGNIVHQWTAENDTFLAQLEPNGNLLYTTFFYPFETVGISQDQKYDNWPVVKNVPSPLSLGHGLYELDYKSNVLWYYPGFFDHDFQILKNGDLLIAELEPIVEAQRTNNGLTRATRCSPALKIINRNKDVLWKWRGEDHVEELRTNLNLKFDLTRDWAHNNTCRMLGDNELCKIDPRFNRNNIIFSYSYLNTIGIINYQTGKIVWAWGPGNIEGQHAPSLLEDGNMLIFDNGTKRGWSRVIELNPLTKKTSWEYHSEPKKDFFSKTLSDASRLPNGNTLICESSKNRIFEVTPKGEIVWEYISPIDTNSSERIYRVYRYSPEYVRPLLEKIKTGVILNTNSFRETNQSLNQILSQNGIKFKTDTQFYILKNFICPVKDKIFHSIIAQNRDRRVELEITKPISQSEAADQIKSRYIIINSLYQPQIIPYTGEISNTAACPEKNKPKEISVQIAGESTKAILANANERYALGVCEDDLIKNIAIFAVWYNPNNETLYQITTFQPSRSFNQDEALLFLKNIENIEVRPKPD
ncbi:MAG: arylsulfotransferase family protein [Candidatus Omnitrophota bacterium]